MAGRPLSCAEVLELVPQQRPFRFIDELLALDDRGARGRYRFRADEFFYAGHFPGQPITPGVILLEAMAQVAVVAHGIYLYGLEHPVEEIRRNISVFSDGEAEFLLMVRPADEVFVRSELIFFRRKKIRARAEMTFADGRVAATATLAGIGVERDAA
jgi:3-hydroxyacyl-[acyl-carrier-protein] dehydratase